MINEEYAINTPLLLASRGDKLPSLPELHELALKLKNIFNQDHLEKFSTVPEQTTTWRLLSLNKGKSKNLYKAVNETRFYNSSSGILQKINRFFSVNLEISMKV